MKGELAVGGAGTRPPPPLVGAAAAPPPPPAKAPAPAPILVMASSSRLTMEALSGRFFLAAGKMTLETAGSSLLPSLCTIPTGRAVIGRRNVSAVGGRPLSVVALDGLNRAVGDERRPAAGASALLKSDDKAPAGNCRPDISLYSNEKPPVRLPATLPVSPLSCARPPPHNFGTTNFSSPAATRLPSPL